MQKSSENSKPNCDEVDLRYEIHGLNVAQMTKVMESVGFSVCREIKAAWRKW